MASDDTVGVEGILLQEHLEQQGRRAARRYVEARIAQAGCVGILAGVTLPGLVDDHP